jgi:hypothetical protein
MHAVQREEDVVVRPAEPLQRDELASDGDIAPHDAELDALPRDRGVDLDGAPEQHLGDLHLLLREDPRAPA